METRTILNILTKELGIKGEDKGKSFFFICPFHNDKKPSLSFEKNEKFFNCFSCEFKAKDIFTFWSKFKKISLDETLDQLEKLGYIEAREKIKNEVEKEEDIIAKILELSSNIYQNNLLTEYGKESLEYLKKERLLKDDLIEQFKIGTSINNNQLSSLFFQENNGYQIKYLAKTSLFNIVDEKYSFDFFREKQIIFPIKDKDGQVVTFASRKIEKNCENKYLFLPSSESKNKSSILYNYDFVKNESNDFCYLVEGFFDVISLTKVGIKNCISLLGTSISKEQIRLLKKLNKKIIIFLDGDEAGIEATIKISTILSLNDIECEIIENKKGMDPDEICNLKNSEIFSIIEKKRIPFLFIIYHYFKKLKVEEDPQKCKRFIVKISDIFHQFRRNVHSFIIKKLSIITKMNFSEVEEIYFSNNDELKIKSLVYDDKINNFEEELIYYSCRDKSFWELLKKEKFIFSMPKNISMIEKIEEFYSKNLLAKNFENFEMKNDFLDLSIFKESEDNKEKIIEKITLNIKSLKNLNEK
ncbi:MAG: DNA primase [Mycoplasmataceae bacterium]|nr:MAG: DNA primase [Mycoplasmataceae bacterium]